MTTKTKISLIALFAFLGIINAFYLSYEAYQIVFVSTPSVFGASFCDINSTLSCTNFFQNPRSLIFGIPFPMIAAVVYPVLFILSLIALKTQSRKIIMTIMILAFGGIAFNGYIITQEFIVGAFCPLCLMCTGYILAIAILSYSIVKNKYSYEYKEKKAE